MRGRPGAGAVAVPVAIGTRPGLRPPPARSLMILENRTRLLLIVSQDVLDQARVIAGRATTALKLPVSLQIVLRALIWVGLKRESHQALLVNIEGQARAVRLQRSGARRRG
jgi:hypothetical protein